MPQQGGFTNITRFMVRLKRIAGDYRSAAEAELYTIAEVDIMGVSKAQYCPVDRGHLRNSGRVDKPKREGNDTVVVMHYGGGPAPYAVFVHETKRVYKNGKQWQYLATPLKIVKPTIGKRLKAVMQGAV